MRQPSFPLLSVVYLRINGDRKGMVTGHLARPGGVTLYLVTWDELEEREHYEGELTTERMLDLPEDPA